MCHLSVLRMPNCTIRPSKQADAADLAILDNIAGHGISLWFWQGAVKSGKAKDALDWGRSRFASDEIFAWRNAYVSETDEMITGSITSYIMPDEDDDADAIKKDAPAFVPVFELYAQAKGAWFIDSFAVYDSFRGHGHGRMLFEDSMKRGKLSGAAESMLVCEDTNEEALPLYRAHGFSEIDQRPFIDFGLNHKTNVWLLLAAQL